MHRPVLSLLLAAALICVAAPLASAARTSMLAPAARAATSAVATQEACAKENETGQPREVQERAMLCLTNNARARAGLAPLGRPDDLTVAADRKAADILGCNSFSHQACGRTFTYWIRRSGYLRANCWRAGENIAWGTGRLGSPRAIFDAWMNSPGHRENILGPYRQIGISMRVGSLAGRSSAAVWVQEFGTHC